MPELKNCPFCRGEASTTDNTVGCDTCGAMMFSSPCNQDKEWNTRPIEDALRREVEELRGVVKALILNGDGLSGKR